MMAECVLRLESEPLLAKRTAYPHGEARPAEAGVGRIQIVIVSRSRSAIC